MGGGTAMWRLKWDAVDWDGMVSLNWNGDKGEIGLLRTGKLLRWRRDAAERVMLCGCSMSAPYNRSYFVQSKFP